MACRRSVKPCAGPVLDNLVNEVLAPSRSIALKTSLICFAQRLLLMEFGGNLFLARPPGLSLCQRLSHAFMLLSMLSE